MEVTTKKEEILQVINEISIQLQQIEEDNQKYKDELHDISTELKRLSIKIRCSNQNLKKMLLILLIIGLVAIGLIVSSILFVIIFKEESNDIK